MTAEHGYIVLHQSCEGVRAVLVLCSDPLCPECERQKAQQRREAWMPVVEAMRQPRMITLTISSNFSLADQWEDFNQSYRRFMNAALGARNAPKFAEEARWEEEARLQRKLSNGDITKFQYATLLAQAYDSVDRFFRGVAKSAALGGKTLRIRDVVGPGFVSREVTYSHTEGWHLHAHSVTDGRYIPHSVIVAVWKYATCGQGQVADVRALDVGTERARQESMKEVIKYLTKMSEIPKEKQAEFRRVVYGKQRIKPLGGAAPAEVKSICPFCGQEDCQALYTGQAHELYRQHVDGEERIVMQVDWGQETKVMTFARRDGVLTMIFDSLVLIPRELASRSGPESWASRAPP